MLTDRYLSSRFTLEEAREEAFRAKLAFQLTKSRGIIVFRTSVDRESCGIFEKFLVSGLIWIIRL